MRRTVFRRARQHGGGPSPQLLLVASMDPACGIWLSETVVCFASVLWTYSIGV